MDSTVWGGDRSVRVCLNTGSPSPVGPLGGSCTGIRGQVNISVLQIKDCLFVIYRYANDHFANIFICSGRGINKLLCAYSKFAEVSYIHQDKTAKIWLYFLIDLTLGGSHLIKFPNCAGIYIHTHDCGCINMYLSENLMASALILHCHGYWKCAIKSMAVYYSFRICRVIFHFFHIETIWEENCTIFTAPVCMDFYTVAWGEGLFRSYLFNSYLMRQNYFKTITLILRKTLLFFF